MRLVAKLVLAMVAGMCAVLAGHAWVRVAREAHLIESDMAQRHVQLGRTLGLALEAAWQRGGEGDVAALLARVAGDAQTPSVAWDAGPAVEGLTPAPAHQIGADLAGERYLVTTLALAGAPGGQLTIAEPLTREAEYLRATIIGEVATGLALALVSGAVALAGGVWLVARPARRLIERARRLGEGDFTTPLTLAQRDELGALATALNAAAARLAEATAAAERAAAQRLAAVEQLRHADRLATVGTLAAGVAHELGTPLTVVAEHGRMIARGGASGAAARDSGRVVVEQTGRMTTIIRHLLDFARRRPPRAAAHDLQALVGETLALLTPLATRRGVILHARSQPDATPAHIDAAQIQQALTNLIVNGIQAMPHGGELTVAVDGVEAAPPPEHGGAAGAFVRVQVRDHGSGIAAEDLPRIFEPFFTTKPVGDGTGLGLSVTWGIVREHGGWIEVQSTPGRGTCFTVYLPAAAAARPALTA